MIALLNDIVDAVDMQFDESSSFLDLNTGKIETVSDDLLRRADDSGGRGRAIISSGARYLDHDGNSGLGRCRRLNHNHYAGIN